MTEKAFVVVMGIEGHSGMLTLLRESYTRTGVYGSSELDIALYRLGVGLVS